MSHSTRLPQCCNGGIPLANGCLQQSNLCLQERHTLAQQHGFVRHGSAWARCFNALSG